MYDVSDPWSIMIDFFKRLSMKEKGLKIRLKNDEFTNHVDNFKESFPDL